MTAYAGIDRIFSPHWQVRAGLPARFADRAQRHLDYHLVGVPMSVLWNKANSDVDPTEGYRLQLDVTP